MAFAHKLGAFNAAVLMTLVYFFILGPIALLTKLGSADPLTLKRGAPPEWIPDEDADRDLLQRAQRQF